MRFKDLTYANYNNNNINYPEQVLLVPDHALHESMKKVKKVIKIYNV